MSKEKHVLKGGPHAAPEQISPESAYLAAVTALPRLIHDQNQLFNGMLDELNGVHDKLDVIALYFERKGFDESLFGPDDFPSGESEENEPAK